MDLNNLNENTKVEVLLKHSNDDEVLDFDLRLFFNYLYLRKFWFILVLLIGVIASLIVSGIYVLSVNYYGKVSTVYNLRFSGIDSGNNPSGGVYNYMEILSSEVIGRTIENTGINNRQNGQHITTEDIRQNIIIQGIVPDDVMDRVLAVNNLVREDPTRIFDLLDIEYNPVQYKLSLNIPRSWKLSKSDAIAFVDTIILTYYEWFIETYSDYGFLAVLDEGIVFETYDYADQLRIIQNRLSSIVSYLKNKDAERPDFISSEKGLRFEDVLLQASILNDVDSNNIDSLIYAYSLTKDKEKLLSIYNIRLLNYELELDSAKQRVIILENALIEYQRPNTTIIVPGVSGNDTGTTYESSDYAEYDSLTRQKIDANNAVIQISHEIEQLRNRISRLENTETISWADTERYIAIVEAGLIQLKKDVENIVHVANIMAEEYFRTFEFKDAVKVSVSSQFESTLSLNTILKISAISVGGIMFAFISFLSIKAILYVSDYQKVTAEIKRKLVEV